MKNILHFLTISLPFITFLTILPSEEAEWLGLPEDITYQVVYHLNHTDIPALKQTCTQWNNFFDYDMLHPDTIAAIDEVVCTRMIYQFAHAKQEKKVLLFYKNNNKEKRNAALHVLGWDIDNNNTQQLMEAHRKGIHVQEERLAQEPEAINIWNAIFCNKITLTMFYVSDNPNIKNYHGDTFLIWASLMGKEEAVKLSLSHPNIEVNAQNTNTGLTALMLACNGGYIEIVKLLLAHPKINLMIQDKSGRTALFIANARARTDISYQEIVALLKAKLTDNA